MLDTRRAVVIEDEQDIRVLLATVLEQAGFEVSTAGGGREGLALVQSTEPLVTTVDLHMPGMDGIETARRIRAVSPTYLVMISASTDEIDTLQGLEAGADDYIAKPFRPRELRARIEAMLRRPRTHNSAPPAPASAAADSQWLDHRGLRLHPQMRIASVDGRELDLTRSEFDILADLLNSGRRVRSKSELALMLRGSQHGSTTFVSDNDARAIEVHMANLRRKLGDTASQPRWIETVRGVGYRLSAAV
ncbi:response regulator transcription factor [Microbacterium terrisoli]|uniref:response regulator transcription factor n=1 Tax=Microbacterium terrisoli TaxID=3242192 RepID=UPI00280623C9|nr:response regulator transcription factor [Microbacterium protaetiae]